MNATTQLTLSLPYLDPPPVEPDIPVSELVDELHKSWHYRIEMILYRNRTPIQ